MSNNPLANVTQSFDDRQKICETQPFHRQNVVPQPNGCAGVAGWTCSIGFWYGALVGGVHSIYILRMGAYVYVHAHTYLCGRIYIIMRFALVIFLKCERLLKTALFWNFFLEIFGGLENSLYFCTRFWEIHFSLATKERVLWKILYKQTSSTRSGLTYTLFI